MTIHPATYPLSQDEMALLSDLRQIVEQARQTVALTVNSELTLMYWHIGERINREILKNERAEYGKKKLPPWPDGFRIISEQKVLRKEVFAE